MSVVLREDQICSLLHMHLMFRQIILIWVSVSLNHQLKIAGSHLVNLITNMSVDLVEPRPTVWPQIWSPMLGQLLHAITGGLAVEAWNHPNLDAD